MPIRIRLTNTPRDSAGRVAVFNSTTGLLEASVVTTDELELLSGIDGGDILTENNVKTVSGKTFNQDLVADADNQHDLGSSGTRWKDAYVAGDVNAGTLSTTGDVVVGGNLVVQGTTTTVNSDTLEVADANVTVNKGGLDTTAEAAGLTVERPSGNGSLIYADASATKFRAGTEGAEVDLVGTTSAQTLTSKTIVAASNTITTAAAGNLAATELNAALAELQGDIDTRATQTDLQDHLNDTTGAHAASAISNSPSGNLSSTTVQAALNELQGDINGLDSRLSTAEGEIDQAQADILANTSAIGTVATDLNNHIIDDTGAHAASAISSAAAGNLAATNVQAALEELQTDVDTRATSAALTSHTGAAAGAHAASAISNAPSGNVAATTVQAAINELQSDIDSRALNSDLTTHTAATSAHGVSGAIVGTSDAQVLTNKDIDGGTAANTRRITLPKDSKANLDALVRKAGTLVYASDLLKAYIDNGTNLVPVGSGAGGGINLLTLDSSWQPNNNDNYDFETSIGNWTAYADAAATAPVDMTGGSPGTTLTRITSSQLNGAASAKADLGSGSSRQGEGWSCLAYVPTGYRGRTLTLKFAYTITGSVVEDELVPYVYDVTNSTLIKPYVKSKLLGSSGTCVATFPVSTTTAQIRVGVHVARTSTAALSVSFDDVVVTPEITPAGLAGSEPISYTPSFTGIGTPSAVSFTYQRVGNMLKVRGNFTTGTPTATAFTFSLPPGLTIDTSITGTPARGYLPGGFVQMSVNTSAGLPTVAPMALFPGTSTSLVYVTSVANGASYRTGDMIEGSTLFGTGLAYSISEVSIPIAGWSSNVSMAESSTFWISSFLANGTRVTGAAPARLGEYRSYLKDPGNITFSETNGTPSVLPSATSGMKITCAGTYAAGDSSGNPSRYEIFVGKNKSVKVSFWAYTGKSGPIDVSPFSYGSVYDVGCTQHYDPLTGIVRIQQNCLAANPNGRIGQDLTASSYVNTAYFDIQVSENALAVGVQSPRSEIILNTGNGHGSTNSAIRRFSVVEKSVGTAFLLSQSATLGDSVTLLEDGVYSVSYEDGRSDNVAYIGVTKNCTTLSTGINGSVAANQRLAMSLTPSGEIGALSTTFLAAAGDVIRPHTNSGPNNTTNQCRFSIVKVSN